MTKEDDDQNDAGATPPRESSEINELSRISETTSSTEFLIRIDEFRARQLSQRGYLKLKSSLNEIAVGAVAEAMLIAVAELKDDPSPTISDSHMASGLLIVQGRRIRTGTKKPWLRSLIENLASGAFFASIALFVDKHSEAAYACVVFAVLATYALFLLRD